MKTIIRNGILFDTASLDFIGDAAIVLENGKIVSVGEDGSVAWQAEAQPWLP